MKTDEHLRQIIWELLVTVASLRAEIDDLKAQRPPLHIVPPQAAQDDGA